MAILRHYFKLSPKTTEVASKNKEIEENGTIPNCTTQKWFKNGEIWMTTSYQLRHFKMPSKIEPNHLHSKLFRTWIIEKYHKIYIRFKIHTKALEIFPKNIQLIKLDKRYF